jgi:deoxyribonuclease-4
MLGEGFSWSPYKLDQDSVNEFRKLVYGMAVYVHLPYTINPCVSKGSSNYNLQQSVIRKYLDVSEAVGATAVVLHPGYKKELTEAAARYNFLKFMEGVTKHVEDTSSLRVLLETDSGSKNGSKIGSPEFIYYVLGKLGKAHYGMCVDTEHMFARGVDLWDADIRLSFLSDYGSMVELVHLNAPDPGVGCGSFLDRHSIPFTEYPVDSTDMIRDLVCNYPAILERKSLVVIEKDVELVTSLVPPRTIGMDIGIEEESRDGTSSSGIEC